MYDMHIVPAALHRLTRNNVQGKHSPGIVQCIPSVFPLGGLVLTREACFPTCLLGGLPEAQSFRGVTVVCLFVCLSVHMLFSSPSG